MVAMFISPSLPGSYMFATSTTTVCAPARYVLPGNGETAHQSTICTAPAKCVRAPAGWQPVVRAKTLTPSHSAARRWKEEW
jgi:hypothetical protein